MLPMMDPFRFEDKVGLFSLKQGRLKGDLRYNYMDHRCR